MNYIFETRMEVRDYECDIEGIVNNANYLHYAEHTRHLFLRSLGASLYVFHQAIFRASDEKMCFRGDFELVCIVNGRLAPSPEYDEAFKDFI